MDADQDQGVKSDGKQIQIRRGIRWKLLTSMIGLIAVLLAILTSLQVSGQKQTQERALERRIALMKKVLNQRGHTLADNLKRQAENDIASFNFSNISELIHKAVREDEELSYAILMDTSRTAYIHTLDAKQEQETLDEPEDRFAAQQAEPSINEYSKRTRSFMEFIQPIRIGTEQWGVLRLGFSLDTLNQEIVHSRAENFQQIQSMAFRSIGTAIVFVLLGVLMVAWISTRISTPLWNLTESANELAKGDFSAADNIQIRSQDELGVLARAFVEMSRQLRVSYERLEDYSKTLEQKVDERTQELRGKNEQLEVTLHKLRDAQKQIIVQEKLASLGSLTAGIAHEIKNPLNFVNNFAELSVDLTEELNEILEDHKEQLDEETRDDLEDILANLAQNATKINEHGKRADSIVKSMLQHSRGKAGERQPTDLNELLEEYVNLAYHGMRAKDASFNVTIERDYDEAVGSMDVVPQDIGRALLNIINNACHAADQRGKESGDGFSPTIWVSTKVADDQVDIRIRDNGGGIPPDVQESIFEPFFTTKPTGQGTGLGLSITHDIVVQEHNGDLRFETEEGEYTEFIISLPRAASQ